MNSKPILRSRLALEMLFGIIAALLLSGGVMFGARELFYRVAEQKMPSQSAMNQAVFERLQAYADQKKLSLTHLDRLDAWQKSERYAEVFLFQDDVLIYPATYTGDAAESIGNYYALNRDATMPLRLSDGTTAQTLIYSFDSARYYNAADTGALMIAFFLFLILIVLLMRKKLRYISLLRTELLILEGGDLTYPMTVQGRDELTELAQGIDSMRVSILEREAGEAQAQLANRELIRALSHDLRTPLTSLMGYLELINMHRYQSEEQLQHFLKSSREKAERIKELSDKLFSYFLIYAEDEQVSETEVVDAYEFLHQVLGEHVFELESAGFTVETDMPELSAQLSMEPSFLLRVFENLFGNILKYGDRAHPVSVGYETQADQTLRISFENAVAADRDCREGSNLGLRTCQAILERLGGSFVARDGERFTVVLTLPLHLRERTEKR